MRAVISETEAFAKFFSLKMSSADSIMLILVRIASSLVLRI